MANFLDRIPYSERQIPVEIAEEYLSVSPDFLQLEGLCFDEEANLYFCDVFQGGIWRVERGTRVAKRILSLKGRNPAAIKSGPDHQLYVACLGDFHSTGSLERIDPISLTRQTIISSASGYVIDDLAFRHDGRFYFSNFIGGATDRSGGIFLSSLDGKDIRRVCGFLGVPNGLSLTSDERSLWVTEMGTNTLHFLTLEQDGLTISDYGDLTPYTFTGLNGPDSCTLDKDGNLYVAIYQQGRVLCFSPAGIPVKQILLPDSWNGAFLRSTHPKIIPGTDTLLICSNDFQGGRGSAIFSAKALAEG